MSKIRIIPTIFALILTLAVLFGGLQIYRNYALIRPLEWQLRHIPSVESAQIQTTSSGPVALVQLGRVTDLQTAYKQIANDVYNTFGSPIGIVLKDRRSPALVAADEELGPILLQGLTQGAYVPMIQQFDRAAAKRHIVARVTMDARNVFVQMSQGSHYLYDILPYSGGALGVNGK